MNYLNKIKNCFNHKLFKFTYIGIINTLFGYSIYASLVFFEIPYLTALVLANIIGIIFNYFSTGRLVFKSTGNVCIFSKFFSVYIITYFINSILLSFFINSLNLNLYYGQLFCLPLIVILNWVFLNYWVFTENFKT